MNLTSATKRGATLSRPPQFTSFESNQLMKRIRFLFALVFTLLAFATHIPAQNFAIDWFTIDGGGGVSTGGVYSVSGTIGQPDAGVLSGGAYTVVGGFWGLFAIQTP